MPLCIANWTLRFFPRKWMRVKLMNGTRTAFIHMIVFVLCILIEDHVKKLSEKSSLGNIFRSPDHWKNMQATVSVERSVRKLVIDFQSPTSVVDGIFLFVTFHRINGPDSWPCLSSWDLLLQIWFSSAEGPVCLKLLRNTWGYWIDWLTYSRF